MKNYIAEIKAFHEFVQDKQLSTGQIALWYALMYINNRCNWAEWFTVANLSLELNTGLSRQGIVKARDVLKQMGVIDFRSNGTKATSYKLLTMSKSVQDSLQDGVQGSLQFGCTLINETETKLYNNTSEKIPDDPSSKNKSTFDTESSPYKLAVKLSEMIHANNLEAKKQSENDLQRWAHDFDLMIRRDNRTPHDIYDVLYWSQNDSFWKSNILSAATLRKQYDRLKLQMKDRK